MLIERLKDAVRRINPGVPVEAQNEEIKEIRRLHSPELMQQDILRELAVVLTGE